jgi:outer membrane protein assembly factor BamB
MRLFAKSLYLLVPVLAATALSGCSIFDDIIQPAEKDRIPGERIPVIAAEAKIEADPQVANLQVVLPKPYLNEAWAQPGGYADNVLQHLEVPGNLQVLWTADAGQGSDSDARLTAAPIMAQGTVFVLDAEAQVRAFNAQNGDLKWEADLTPEEEESDEGFGGGLAFDDGKIFVSTGFGFIACLDAATGTELWRHDAKVPFRAAPTVNEGRVYVSTQENQLLALATADGRVQWDARGIAETAGMLGSTSPAVEGDVVVVPFTSGELVALRATNGRSAWTDSLTRGGQRTAMAGLNDIAGRPVIDRGLVIAISHSGKFAAIDLSSGERIWTQDIAGVQTPWVAGDFIYVVSLEGELFCIHRADGRVKWVNRLQRYEDAEAREGPIEWRGPVLVSDRLLLASSTGNMISVSPYSGETLGGIEIPDGVFISPIVANGTVFVLTDEGELIALR